MIQFIDSNGLLCNSLHGFRSGRSCLTQLLGHFDDVFSGMVSGSDVDVIYLDYAKVFDKVDHRLLLKKFKRYGFPEKLISEWCFVLFSSNYQLSLIGYCFRSLIVHLFREWHGTFYCSFYRPVICRWYSYSQAHIMFQPRGWNSVWSWQSH